MIIPKSAGPTVMEHVISASKFTRNFDRYQMLAQKEPIAVTSHGRTTGYFIAEEDYEAFKRFQAARRAFTTAELLEEKANAISASCVDARHAHLDAMLKQ
jgi:PHD/YefM family antitoxin component YafN of YafNO toxin-antitoxin module